MAIKWFKHGLVIGFLALILVCSVAAQDAAPDKNEVTKDIVLHNLTAQEVMTKLDTESWDPTLSLRYFPGGFNIRIQGPKALVKATSDKIISLDRPRRVVEYEFRLSRVASKPVAGDSEDVKRQVIPPQELPETEELAHKILTLTEGEKNHFVLAGNLEVTFRSGQVEADDKAVTDCVLSIQQPSRKKEKKKPVTLRARLPHGMRTVFVLPKQANTRATILLEMKASIKPLNPKSGSKLEGKAP